MGDECQRCGHVHYHNAADGSCATDLGGGYPALWCRCPSSLSDAPDVIDLIQHLRAALGLPHGALPWTPRQAWMEAMRLVAGLRRKHG